MSTPIKSNAQANGATGSANLPFALNELASKMNGSAQGVNLDNPEQAFARWMERHSFESKEQAPKASAMTPPTRDSSAMARLGEQAIARMRQQTATAHQPVVQREAQPDKPEQAASGAQATSNKPASDKQAASKTARKEAAKPTQQADKPRDTEKPTEETPFSTAAGDGAALVRELTPPSTIQPGDSAAMMAWLSSLAHGELKQGADGSLQAAATQAADNPAMTDAGTDAEGADIGLSMNDMLQRGRGHAAHGGAMLDLSNWQSASAKGEELAKLTLGATRPDADPAAGMLAAGAMKAGSFGQILEQTTQGVRHETATLNVPFGDATFTQALSDQVSMWVRKAQGDGPMTAELHLNPAEMGPINVKISLDGQSAQVNFAAAALETRQAIEASLPLLSSALGDVGLNLTGGDVSSQTSQQAFQQSAQSGDAGRRVGEGRSGRSDDAEEGPGVRQVAAPRPGRAGGLDLYA